MADNITTPLFANRYRFETASDDWDTGRSGLTHLVFDTVDKKRCVIKRSETSLTQAVQGLKNEAKALQKVAGPNVPKYLSEGEAAYGSRRFYYIVIEFIEGVRVEREYKSLEATERADILMQFFALLGRVHQAGVINGDIDIKHLFWKKEQKQLFVIDWGNAILGLDPRKSTEFSSDLARSAEIIFALVTRHGPPPATGTLALPDDGDVLPGLVPLPAQFYKLCSWAPRGISDAAQAPLTAQELHDSAQKWLTRLASAKQGKRSPWPLFIGIAGGILVMVLAAAFILQIGPFATATPTLITETQNTATTVLPFTATPSVTAPSTITHTPTATQTILPSQTFTSVPTETWTPTIVPTIPVTPAPVEHVQIINFNKQTNISLDTCWVNELGPTITPTSLPSALNLLEKDGFSRREEKNWQFMLGKSRISADPIQANFSDCLNGQTATALGFNAWMEKLGFQEEQKIISEFGIYMEDDTGQRREYTFWVNRNDINNIVNLRLRENNTITDYKQPIIPAKREGNYPYSYNQISVLVFLEINNQGLDILYLSPGPGNQPVDSGKLDPNQMIRIDDAVRPALGSIRKIGLVGRGVNSQIIFWPLTFYGK